MAGESTAREGSYSCASILAKVRDQSGIGTGQLSIKWITGCQVARVYAEYVPRRIVFGGFLGQGSVSSRSCPTTDSRIGLSGTGAFGAAGCWGHSNMALSERPSARHRPSHVGQDMPRRCRCSRSSGGVTWAATSILRANPLKPAQPFVGGGSGVKGMTAACSSSRGAACSSLNGDAGESAMTWIAAPRYGRASFHC